MKQRIITGIVGIILFFLVLTLFNTSFFNLICLAIYLIAVYEIHGAFKEKNSIGIFALLTLLGIYAFVLPVYIDIMTITSVVVLIFACIVVFQFNDIDFKTVSASLLFGLYTLFGFHSIFTIREAMPYSSFGWDGAFLFVMAVVIAWGGDIFAYFTGYFLGKHKLAPVLSPKKTIEGAVGGVVGSIISSWFFLWGYSFLKPMLENTSADYAITSKHIMVLAVVAGLGSCVGIIGDLFRSAVKRQTGIKDYGNIFPGHGGILDRFDSVLLVAPLMAVASAYIANMGGIFGV